MMYLLLPVSRHHRYYLLRLTDSPAHAARVISSLLSNSITAGVDAAIGSTNTAMIIIHNTETIWNDSQEVAGVMAVKLVITNVNIAVNINL